MDDESRKKIRNQSGVYDDINQAKILKPMNRNQRRRNSKFLRSDCPVWPLGHKGGVYYYINAAGEIIEMTDQGHIRTRIEGLLGVCYDWAVEHYGEGFDKKGGVPKRVATEQLGRDLRSACYEAGPFDPQKKLRGVGYWKGANNTLVAHFGDELWTSNGVENVGEKDGFIYPTFPPLSKPSGGVIQGGERGPGRQILALIEKWNWQRSIDPKLVLGFISCAILGGALDWRPHLFVTGDRGTGKSSLLQQLAHLMGDALIESSNTTAAGLHQQLGFNSIAVWLDEQESAADSRETQKVLNLIRQSSSGGQLLRGGSDHTATLFCVRSCFLLAASRACLSRWRMCAEDHENAN